MLIHRGQISVARTKRLIMKEINIALECKATTTNEDIKNILSHKIYEINNNLLSAGRVSYSFLQHNRKIEIYIKHPNDENAIHKTFHELKDFLIANKSLFIQGNISSDIELSDYIDNYMSEQEKPIQNMSPYYYEFKFQLS